MIHPLPAHHDRLCHDIPRNVWRFLWDLRQTVSEMIASIGSHMRTLAHEYGLTLIEPYDMTPCDDKTLGAAADIPMCDSGRHH